MRLGLATLVLASAGVASGCASGPQCPADGRELPVEALYGNWEARLEGVPGVAKLQLSRHPEYAGVRGIVVREASGASPSVAQLAGDIGDDGVLNIDESRDGRGISGVWTAELQPGACGKAFKGTWKDASDDSTHPFTLNKTGNPP